LGTGRSLATPPAASNTATGLQSLYHNVNGVNNTATGVFSPFNNISGFNNTAVGWKALHGNTTANFNTAIGVNALKNNNQGQNTAVGYAAAFSTPPASSRRRLVIKRF
jgi:hypothetical protein